MSCKNCNSERVAFVSGKCSDRCSFRYKDQYKDGYVPSSVGIGGGDEVEVAYCLDCGMIQSDEFPISEERIVESFEEC